MNPLLLDTHTFIWWENDLSRLSPRVLTMCLDPANQLLLSVASIWEMQIKIQLGKLKLPRPLPDVVRDQLGTNRVRLLAIDPVHVYALGQFPPAHKDPFDRILAAQAHVQGMPLLSNDPIYSQYPVTVIW